MSDRPSLPSSRSVTIDTEIIYILGMHDAGAHPSDIAARVGRRRTTIDRVTETYDPESWSRRMKPNVRSRITSVPRIMFARFAKAGLVAPRGTKHESSRTNP